MIHVQHLLGTGHVVRAARLANALAAIGHKVVMVTGGPPVEVACSPAVKVEQLAPIRAGRGGFTDLVGDDGRPAGETLFATRRERLLALLHSLQPAALVIEAWPFGRRRFACELIPLLEAAHALKPRPAVICSVRDIVQRRPLERDRESAALVRRFFDAVLVHGDPALCPFERSFSQTGEIADTISHTGLIGPGSDASPPPPDEPFDVVVSAGGGAVGDRLLRAALAARPLCRFKARRWLVVAGAFGRTANLQPADNVTIAPYRPDLPRLLPHAAVSVSQAGYNTCAEIIHARCPAVVAPYADDGESEQTMRATAMARLGLARVVEAHELQPASLAAAIDRAAGDHAPTVELSLNGARTAAGRIDALIANRA